MFHPKHHSFFPFVLAILTFGLLVFMYFSFTSIKVETKSVQQEVVPVSSQEYQTELEKINDEFVVSYETAETEMAKLVLVEKTLSKLLSLRVPAEFKDKHLELAVLLNQIQTALLEQKDTTELFDRLYVTLSEANDL